jgi:3-dehydroquinate synthase
VVDGQIRFILARGIGKAFVTSEAPRDTVVKMLAEALAARA